MKVIRRVNKAKFRTVALFVIGFIISCLLIPKFSAMAIETRGYRAVGGEVLIPLLYLLLAALMWESAGLVNELHKEEQQKENAQ